MNTGLKKSPHDPGPSFCVAQASETGIDPYFLLGKVIFMGQLCRIMPADVWRSTANIHELFNAEIFPSGTHFVPTVETVESR